jgi:hypothetical protein
MIGTWSEYWFNASAQHGTPGARHPLRAKKNQAEAWFS